MSSALAAILSRPRAVLSMMLVMLIAGIWSFAEIPKEADPDIQIPAVYISIPLPGISPEDSERLLVKPVESKLKGLDGIKDMTGIATESHAGIFVRFETGVDIDQAITDTREKLDLANFHNGVIASAFLYDEVAGIGRYNGFVPWPVITGFTNGIAVIIFLQQLPLVLGVGGEPAESTLVASTRTVRAFLEAPSGPAVVLAVTTAAVFPPSVTNSTSKASAPGYTCTTAQRPPVPTLGLG